jgi:hypothetical protein
MFKCKVCKKEAQGVKNEFNTCAPPVGWQAFYNDGDDYIYGCSSECKEIIRVSRMPELAREDYFRRSKKSKKFKEKVKRGIELWS